MHKFDYSFLKQCTLRGNLINVLTDIYSIKGADEFRREKFPNVYTELQKIAIIKSVKSSNAIENILTTDERINAIVNQHCKPLNHDEQEIAGYRDVISKIHNNYQDLSFNEKDILSFHEILLLEAKPKHAGHYKSEDNVIMEVKSDGTKSIRFKPVSSSETPKAMEQLFLAYIDARDNLNINPLLLIPCVILDFLCIHPFADGNGRMSRLLTLLLLYKNGFTVGKYISFEEQINNYKDLYYDALYKSSIRWENNENDYGYFIENFLTTLFVCYKELDKRFITLNNAKINKKSRIEAAVLNSLVPISKSEICSFLPDVSPTTVELVLSQLVKSEKVVKVGIGKRIKYLRK